MYGVNEDYHGIFDSVCPESSPRQPEQARPVCGQRRPISGPGEDRDTIQGYRDRDEVLGQTWCVACVSSVWAYLEWLCLQPWAWVPDLGRLCHGMAGCEVNMTSLCLCLSPGLSLVIVTGLWLAGPCVAPRACHIQLQDIVMQLSALSSVQRGEGGRIAICINCKMSSSGGDRLWPEPGLARAGVRAIRYFLIIDTYLETITDKGWAGIMTRIKVMQAPSQAEPLQGPTMPLFQDCQSVRDVKIIWSEYSWPGWLAALALYQPDTLIVAPDFLGNTIRLGAS